MAAMNVAMLCWVVAAALLLVTGAALRRQGPDGAQTPAQPAQPADAAAPSAVA
jgi:hypothetical protein